MNEQKGQVATHRELKILAEVNQAAEDFYEKSVDLGEHAAEVFGNRHRSQMTNLENIANSAFKVSDVYDYIKRQMARYEFWRRPYKGSEQLFGLRLLDELSQDLLRVRDSICSKVGIDDTTDEERHLRRHVHLLLIRQFIQQMIVHYEFRTNMPEAQSSVAKGQKRG